MRGVEGSYRKNLVGAVRFELTTTGTPCRYATRLRYAPRRRIIAAEPRAPRITAPLLPAQHVDDALDFLAEHRGEGHARRAGRGAQRLGRLRHQLVEAVARAADGEAL